MSALSAVKVNLTASVVTTYGDTAKTFVTSKINTKVVSGKTCLSAPFNSWTPVFDDTGGAPVEYMETLNGRMFSMNAVAAGVARLSLWEKDSLSGAYVYIGGLNITLINSPATTHTSRWFKVDDGSSPATVTGWRIFVGTTGTVTANGGPYMAMSVAKTDFTAVPTTLPTATVADAKQVYKLENAAFTLTQAVGAILQRSSTKLYAHNGVAATHQYAKFDYSQSTGTPGANGVTTALIDPAFVASNGITGNLPAASGTLLLTNSEFLAQPAASPNPAPLLGSDCAFYLTGTTAYMGKLSELTGGSSLWPSLQSCNFLTPSLLINPTPVGACWSNDIDRMILNASNNQFVVKPFQSGVIDYFFGSTDSQYLEAGGFNSPVNTVINYGGITTTRLQAVNGYAYAMGTTVGQRGIFGTPIKSDYRYLGDYIITPVIETPSVAMLISIARIRPLRGKSTPFFIQYRVTGFASETVGWLDLPTVDDDLSTIGTSQFIQFRLLIRIANNSVVHTDALAELTLIFQLLGAFGDNWEYSREFSASGSPTDSVFRLRKVFASGIVPLTTTFRAQDLTDVELVNGSAGHNIVANAANFAYSTNNNVSYNPLGTVPNVVGTLLRYRFSSPPGVDIRPSLRDN